MMQERVWNLVSAVALVVGAAAWLWFLVRFYDELVSGTDTPREDEPSSTHPRAERPPYLRPGNAR